MRALPFALLATFAAAPAHADSFAGVVGGLMIPLGDGHSTTKDGWSDLVSSSPKLGVQAGAVGESGVGGMVSADWTPVSSNANSAITNVSANRFRILAHVMFEKPVAPKLTLEGRAGAGIDIAHASASTTVLGTTFSASDTDVGFAFELGGGVWFDLGGVKLGGEIALPFGFHSHKSNANNDLTLDYTSYDIDLLFGLRSK